MANAPPPPLLLCLPFLFSLFLPTSTANNYTVGGDAGWLFSARTNASATNYTLWASSRSFYLGDFLVFNTDASSTVIQTYNETTYELCSLEQDYGNQTSQFGDDDLEEGGGAGGIPVQLVKEGVNFFFSSADGGLQCREGMRFQIKVQHGNGLPPPPAPPTVVASPERSQVSYDSADRDGGERWKLSWWGIASCVALVAWLL